MNKNLPDPQYESLTKQLEERKAQERQLRSEIVKREKELSQLTSSLSWRITQPLRKASLLSRKALKKTKHGRRIAKAVGSRLKPGNTEATTRAAIAQDAQSAITHKDWSASLSALGTVIADLWKERFQLSVIDRLSNIESYKAQIRTYERERKKQKGKLKIAIYTAMTGNYESLKLPELLDPRFDYFVFTDSPVHDTGIFQIRPITYFNEDATRTARFVKTHPHWFLREYDVAIWVDASIMITGDIYPMVEKFIASKKAVGAIPHPHRKTIAEELKACLAFGKDNAEEMTTQVDHYHKEGFDGSGLIESGLMIFDLKQKDTSTFLDFWWKEIDNYSRRDQLSAGYAFFKNKLAWHPLTKAPHSIRDHPCFVLTVHGSEADGLMLELLGAVSRGTIHPYAHVPFSKEKAKRQAAQSKRKIDVIVCVHNAPVEVKLCLESIGRHRKSPNLKLIVVDDGSDQPTAEYLKGFVAKTSWAKLVRHETAGGYTKAANAGLRVSSGELAILLNSDTVVTDGWTEKMADAIFSTPGAGIVGPMSSAASVQSLPDFRSSGNQTAINDLPKGVSIDGMNTYCENWSSVGLLPYATMLHGFCFGIRREVLDTIGLFDDKSFPRGYGEENDYCFRAVNAGFGLVVATNTYIFHAKSKSYKSEVRVQLMEAGAQKLRELHGRRRITNAIRSMQEHPILVRMRREAQKLY